MVQTAQELADLLGINLAQVREEKKDTQPAGILLPLLLFCFEHQAHRQDPDAVQPFLSPDEGSSLMSHSGASHVVAYRRDP
ncbi:hypothetical protein [Reticulibacter mediterranei]|uniref:hypothetical protein n=1 Tax=Reticulibacter mediterranei TaxID=2778369 RepID=UPI001C6916E9|nr:hypothetical protein [Reticulibacter mediterranei]